MAPATQLHIGAAKWCVFGAEQASLSTVDLESGKLLEREWLWNTALSLRHMAVSKEGDVAVGFKNYGQ